MSTSKLREPELVTTPEGAQIYLPIFDSPVDFCGEALKLPASLRRDSNGGHHSAESVAEEVHNGSPTMAMAARKLLDKVQTDGLIQSMQPSWQPDLVGAYPSIPAYLAGAPACMMARHEQASDLGPVKIVVGIGAGGAFSNEQIARRGAALVATIIAVSQVRPVEAWAYAFTSAKNDPMRGMCALIPLGTGPFDPDSLSTFLSHAGIHRTVAMGLSNGYHGNKGVESGPFVLNGGEAQNRFAANALGITERDLFVPRVFNRPDAALRDPLAFVRKQLLRLTDPADYLVPEGTE